MPKLLLLIVLLVSFSTGLRAQERTKQQQAVFDTVLDYHSNNPECGLGGKRALFSEYIPLEKNRAIVLASCEIGAWQVNWMAYFVLVDEQIPSISQLSFPHTNGKYWTADLRINFPQWDEESKTLTTESMDDRSGTCGSISRYKWSEYRFHLVRAQYQPCCENDNGSKSGAGCENADDEDPLDSKNWPVVFQLKQE